MSDGLPRRRLDDLVTLYTLQPELRDIYVEGEFDAFLYAELLTKGRQIGLRKVFSIDHVEVPAEKLRVLGLTSGNKQRVLALARHLDEAMKGNVPAQCIVDSDLELFQKIDSEPTCLLRTDYTTSEMYILAISPLMRFARAFIKGAAPEDTIQSVADSADRDLPTLTCLRLALWELEISADVDELARRLGKGTMDLRTELGKLKGKAPKVDFEKIQRRMKEWSKRLQRYSPRERLYGGDFLRYLWVRIQKACRLPRATDEASLLRILANCVEWDDVKNERLFRVLTQPQR